MTEIEFEARIQTFWEKVQTLYAPYIAKGGILGHSRRLSS